MASSSRKSDPKRKMRGAHFNLIRQFVLADFITLGNAACGTIVLFLCLEHVDKNEDGLWLAFALLPLALVFDIADGAVARWRHHSSPFGGDLDSLADAISFGVAPAVLGFTLGLRGGLDRSILVFNVCCGISRLARYNVTVEALSGGTGKVPFYQGLPIPANLWIVALLAFCFWTDRVGDALPGGELEVMGMRFHPLSLAYVLNGFAMVSQTLRIPKP